MTCDDLAGYMIGKGFIPTISGSTVWRILKADRYVEYEKYKESYKEYKESLKARKRSAMNGSDDGGQCEQMAIDSCQKEAEPAVNATTEMATMTCLLQRICDGIILNGKLLSRILNELGVSVNEEAK